jgi:2-polyprenyl-3-methyl-5-hydroxy-6-metoxy-1,4-benzoquinol methylase
MNRGNIMSSRNINEKNISRFALLFYPLESYNDSKELRRDDYRIQGKTYKKPLYPIRAMTYWWVTHVLREELQRLCRPLVIADIGCERGLLKRFVPTTIIKEGSNHWIGMDMRKEPEIDFSGYNEFHICDFNEGLPLGSSSIDVVALLNVLEHLTRPD